MPKATTKKSKPVKRVAKKRAQADARRNGKRPAKKQPTFEELTLRSFQLAYQQHHHPETA